MKDKHNDPALARSGRLIGLGLVITAAATIVWAHEGHLAITTKGVKIDEDGLLNMEPAARRAVGLDLAKVDFGTIEESVQLNVRVMLPWNQMGFASSQVEGVVTEVLVRPGQVVRAGTPLAVIDSLPLEALQLELKQAQIELELAEQNVQRAHELGETIVPGREILALEVMRDGRQNTISMLRKKLEIIGPDEGREVSVTAPIDGTVVHLDVMLGRHVMPTDHLFEIHDAHVVWAECEVPEVLVGTVVRGQRARLTFSAWPGRTWSGTIEFSSVYIGEMQNAQRVWVTLDNAAGDLLPGMFGTAAVTTRLAEGVFVAPVESIVTDGAERYAFVQAKEGVYDKKNVVLGATDGRFVEVVEGLYPGDTVITAGNHEISSLFVQGTLELSEEAKRNIGFAVEEVDLRPIDNLVYVNARVVPPPDRHAAATNRIEGKIEKIHVLVGQEVEAGQSLAEVSSLRLQNRQLELILVDLQRALVRKQLGYIRKLTEKGIPPRKELLRLESEHAELTSRFESIRRALLVLGIDDAAIAGMIEAKEPLPVLTIRAPLAGHVSHIRAVLGQVVHPGQEIFAIVDLDKVWVEGSFFEADMAGLLDPPIEKSASIRTVAHGERRWAATVSFLNRALSGGENVLKGWVELDNEENALLPGMHATLAVLLPSPEERVIAVPDRALLSVGRTHYVFVEQGAEYKRVEVELGRRDVHYAEVLSDVYPGDRVVVSGVNELNNAFSSVR